MRRRSLALAVTVVPILWFGSSGVLAQDDFPTAAELLQQGIEQMSAGDFDSAEQTLGRVDRMQLSREDRRRLDQALRDAERGAVTPPPAAPEPAPARAVEVSEPAPAPVVEPAQAAPVAAPAPEPTPELITPERMLAEADALAVSANRAEQQDALVRYRELMDLEAASLEVRSLAAARRAQLNRKLNSDLTAARRMIDMAGDDVRAGRLANAQRKLDDLDASGVGLTWFDRQRIDALRAEIGNVTMAAAGTPTPTQSVESTPVAAVPQAPSASGMPQDLIQQARGILSQEKFAEGQEAQRQGQLALAAQLYDEAISLDPTNVEARQALPAVTAALASRQQQNDALSTDALVRQIRQESAIAAFDEAVNEANASASSLNYAAALDAVARAQQVLDRNRQWISPDRLADLRQQATGMQAALITQRDRHQAELTRQIENRRRAEQEADRLRDLENRRKQVDQLLIRAHELNASQNYAEALELVDQALFIQHDSFAAELLRSTIINNKTLTESRKMAMRRQEAMMGLALENRAKIIPNAEPLVYPTDWPEITQRRLENLPGGGDSESTREAIRQLRQVISVTFDQSPLESVIDALQIQTGANFFVNWNALEIAGVDRDSLVTLNLNNVTAERVLRLVLQQLSNDFERLSFSVIDGVVTISTELDLRSVSDLRVYDIRDLLVQIPNFTGAPDFDLAAALEEQEGGGSSIFSEGDEEDEDDETLREEAIEEITTLVQESVGTPDEWLNLESTIRELNGQLIIRTSPENHRELSQLLDDIRESRSSQITVEARLLLVDENFLEDIGFDVDFRMNNLGSNYTSLSVAQDSSSVAAATGTALTPGVFRPSTGLGNTFVDQPGTPAFSAPTGFASTGRALEMGVAYLDDLEVNLLIRATQNHRRAISLTAPHVTFANGQRSYIFVARQTSYISDLEVVSDAAALDPEVSVFSTGVILDVEGTISSDRRYVTLTLRPSLSQLFELRQIPFIGTADIDTGTDDDQQNIIVSGTQELPVLDVTQIRATVSIPDRGTLLLGGQRLIGEVEIESGVPMLSKIPVVKRLFSNSSNVKDERTLLVLVKPTIIILNEEEELRFPGLLQDPALYNEGRSSRF
ncbi:MAG: hypothetical protein RLN76_09565 [Phycisphaeraceae bacterium]